MRRFVAFAAVTAALILALLLVMHLMFPADETRHAVRVSAAIALLVQLLGFAIARAVARDNVVAGWGLAVLLRFGAVFAFAFSARAIGLETGPALISLVVFLFVSTLIEPLFLKP